MATKCCVAGCGEPLSEHGWCAGHHSDVLVLREGMKGHLPPDRKRGLGVAAAGRLSLVEGLLVGLSGRRPLATAYASAQALLAGEKKVLLGVGRKALAPAEVDDTRRALAREADELRGLVEACGGTKRLGKPKVKKGTRPEKEAVVVEEAHGGEPVTAPPKARKPKPLPGAGRGAGAQVGREVAKKAKGRTGEAADSGFEAAHPRAVKGRVGGGQWIVKRGDGMGAEGPNGRVGELQQRLHQLGFKVDQDGQFGPLTEEAVRAFQRKQGLATTGKVDERTLAGMRTADQGTGRGYGDKYRGTAGAGARGAQNKSLTGEADLTPGSSGGSRASGSKAKADASSGGSGHGAAGLGAAGQGTARKGPARTGEARTGEAGGGRAKQDKGLKGESLHKGQGMGDRPDKAVKDLQRILDELGYDLGEPGVDGRFGPDTTKAVKKLQRRYGLKTDGIVGKHTKALLKRIAKRHMKAKQEGKFDELISEALIEWAEPDLRETLLLAPTQAPSTPGPTVTTNHGAAALGAVQADPPPEFIVDGRDLKVAVLDLFRGPLEEAVERRKRARSGSEFTAARACEDLLRADLKLVEAVAGAVPFDERLHPRSRVGRWIEGFHKALANTNSDQARQKRVERRLRRVERDMLGFPPGTGNTPLADAYNAQHGVSPAHTKAVVASMDRRKFKSREEFEAARAVAPDNLPENPDLYFTNPPGAVEVPLNKLRPIRARPEGIKNAATYMARAARRDMPKRKPITLRRLPDGSYEIVDGNSTYANAAKNGWKSIRAIVEHRPVRAAVADLGRAGGGNSR